MGAKQTRDLSKQVHCLRDRAWPCTDTPDLRLSKLTTFLRYNECGYCTAQRSSSALPPSSLLSWRQTQGSVDSLNQTTGNGAFKLLFAPAFPQDTHIHCSVRCPQTLFVPFGPFPRGIRLPAPVYSLLEPLDTFLCGAERAARAEALIERGRNVTRGAKTTTRVIRTNFTAQPTPRFDSHISYQRIMLSPQNISTTIVSLPSLFS